MFKIPNLAALLIAMHMVSFCWAHPMVVHQGSLTWNDKRLLITLSFDAHSLEHELAVATHSIDAQTAVRRLAESICVFTDTADRLVPAITIEGDVSYRVELDYEVPAGSAALALLHRPDGEIQSLPRQFHLIATDSEHGTRKVHYLTSGGNHELLLRKDKVISANSYSAPDKPVLIIRKESHNCRLELVVEFPCVLLQAWPGLMPMEGDRIAGDAAKTHRAAIKAWTKKNLHTGCGDVATAIKVAQITLIGPLGESLAASEDHAYSIYTTRLRVEAIAERVLQEDSMRITWRGFNPSVLMMPVRLEREGSSPVSALATRSCATIRLDDRTPNKLVVEPTADGQFRPQRRKSLRSTVSEAVDGRQGDRSFFTNSTGNKGPAKSHDPCERKDDSQ